MQELTYDWELSHLFKSEAEAKLEVEQLKQLYKRLPSFKGKLHDKNQVLKYYKLQEEIDQRENLLMCYLALRSSLNGTDVFYREIISDFSFFVREEMAPKISFIAPELAKNNNLDLNTWRKDESFANYENLIEDIIENKKHILPERLSSILSQNSAWGGYEGAYDNLSVVDMKFGYLNTDNGREELTHASYLKFIRNKDQRVRKSAYEKMHSVYAGLNYTIGSLYLGSVKETIFHSKIAKYKSVLHEVCKQDKSDVRVLQKLIDVVNLNLDLYHRQLSLQKQALGVKNYFAYDTLLEFGENDRKFNYQEAVDIVLESLSVMGEDYVSRLKKAVTSGWIDVYEKPAKTTGGFSLAVYGSHPYILLNYTNNYNSVSTLAHELGHAMHSCYSSENQNYYKSDCPIFTAEVASTVNEILLNRYMIEKAKTKKEKLFCVHQLLTTFSGTVFSQVMYSEFEKYVYDSLENQKPVLVEYLNNKWEELQKKYSGGNVIYTKYSKFLWSEIPHFYSSYYVYKYATGFISAIIIANNLIGKKDGFLNKYLQFLSSGCSEKPIDLLKAIDVDLTDKRTMQTAFDFFKNLLDEFEELTKE